MADAGPLETAHRRLLGAHASLQAYATELAQLLTACPALWKPHGNDFFRRNLWNDLPLDWREALAGFDIREELQANTDVFMMQWPPVVQSFVDKARALSLRRHSEYGLGDAPIPQLVHMHRCGMIPKKCHEVPRLAALVDYVARGTGASNVIDFGSGKGYTSQVLAFDYRLNAICIECEESNNVAACKRTEGIRKMWEAAQRKRQLPTDNSPSVRLVTARVPLTVTAAGLADIAATARSSQTFETAADNGGGEGFDEASTVLLGLHACGDLSPAMIRLFASANCKLAALVDVPCCYNRLSENAPTAGAQLHSFEASSSEVTPGFPMSEHVRRSGMWLGHMARNLSVMSWTSFVSGDPNQAFDGFFYRAAVQAFVAQYQEVDECLELGPYRQSDFQGRFTPYARECLARLTITADVSDDIVESFATTRVPELRNLAIWWGLRAVCAELLESFILIDYALFAEEQGLHPYLTQLFDGSISPRNTALVVTRATARPL